MLSTLKSLLSLSQTSLQPATSQQNLLAKYRGNIVASNSFQQQCCLVYDGLKTGLSSTFSASINYHIYVTVETVLAGILGFLYNFMLSV